MKRSTLAKAAGLFAYVAFVAISILVGFEPGKRIGDTFVVFAVAMLSLLPCAFVLIGLFEVWVRRETVEKHLGRDSGLMGHIWGVLFAGTTVGGLYVAFPVSYTLHEKGAKLSVVFTYLACSAICRVPMTIFEISFMGVKFSVIRLMVSLPLVILSSILLGDYLERRGYRIAKGK